MYTNQQYDKESGLYYYNARYYDPHLGSFITPDPAMQGLNHYTYANSNPIKYSDPTGLSYEGEDYSSHYAGLSSGATTNTPPSGSSSRSSSSSSDERKLAREEERKYRKDNGIGFITSGNNADNKKYWQNRWANGLGSHPSGTSSQNNGNQAFSFDCRQQLVNSIFEKGRNNYNNNSPHNGEYAFGEDPNDPWVLSQAGGKENNDLWRASSYDIMYSHFAAFGIGKAQAWGKSEVTFTNQRTGEYFIAWYDFKLVTLHESFGLGFGVTFGFSEVFATFPEGTSYDQIARSYTAIFTVRNYSSEAGFSGSIIQSDIWFGGGGAVNAGLGGGYIGGDFFYTLTKGPIIYDPSDYYPF